MCACCGEKKAPAAYEVLPKNECTGKPSGVVCKDGVAFTCSDGGVAEERDCKAEKLTCDLARGCELCKPFEYDCVDNDLYRCNSAGTKSTLKKRCADDLQCSEYGCRDLCAAAAASHSYIGCEYWPVFTSNSQLDPVFKPAVVIANPNLIDAHVSVSLAGRQLASRTIPRQNVAVIELAFDPVLKGVLEPDALRVADSFFSVQGQGLAYHLVSDAPVTVHQFNPLLYEVPLDCPDSTSDDDPNDGLCNSYTNDTSLLLPVHALQADYLVVGRPSFMFQATSREGATYWDGLPGFVAISGVTDQPTEVRVRTRAHTLASRDGKIMALAPGDDFSTILGEGEVLQLLGAIPTDCKGKTGSYLTRRGVERTVCDPGRAYDLTGTEIDADSPVQVISGNDCSFVPFDVPSCDHLEEALFPIETWGSLVMVTRPSAIDGEPYVFRVVSGDDNNRISFDPAVHATVTLNRGDFVEIETDQHVAVSGKKRILVAQFLVGQGASKREGDPSMGLAVPIDQYLSRYVFLSPDTYEDKFVNVIAYGDTQVALDGETIEDFESIGKTQYRVATVRLGDKGEHSVESADGSGVGLILYGYADFTSYMSPAGLELRVIGAPL